MTRNVSEAMLYVNVSELDSKRSRRVAIGSLPLHLTVIPPFTVGEKELPDLSRDLRTVIRRHHHIGISTLEEMQIEQDGEQVRARKIGGSLLYPLHSNLLPVVREHHGRLIRAQHVDAHYLPHVTLPEGEDLDWGHNWRYVKSVVMSQRQDKGWQVRDVFDLQPHDYSFDNREF